MDEEVKKRYIRGVRRRFVFEPNGKPTSKIDVCKVNMRIFEGDDYYGTPEKDMFGHRTYNGRWVRGIEPKLRDKEYMKTLVEEWSKSGIPHYIDLAEEYLHPGTFRGIIPFEGVIPEFGCSPLFWEAFRWEEFYLKYGYDEDVSSVNEEGVVKYDLPKVSRRSI